MSIPAIAVAQPEAWSAGYQQGRADAVAVIDQHIPSVTRAVEAWAMDGDPEAWDEDGDYVGDVRDCACGVRVNGFYEYVDHLKGVLA